MLINVVLPCAHLLQITRGLLQKHGAERVRDTPITEVKTGQPVGLGSLGMGGVGRESTEFTLQQQQVHTACEEYHAWLPASPGPILEQLNLSTEAAATNGLAVPKQGRQ